MHHIVRAKASTSSDAGPLVDSREILAALREHVGDADRNLIPVKHLLQQAWSDLASVLDTELGELSPELSARLAKLQSVDRLLVDRLDAPRIPTVLRVDGDGGDALERRLRLVPGNGRVLDGLAHEVAAELDPELPHALDIRHLGL
ncbi:MAG: hypothetical protein INR66_24740, partial [Gordonia polyisoprenivorans]|nr:hypothetical protein [Gordonia polyisoprenivorans]